MNLRELKMRTIIDMEKLGLLNHQLQRGKANPTPEDWQQVDNLCDHIHQQFVEFIETNPHWLNQEGTEFLKNHTYGKTDKTDFLRYICELQILILMKCLPGYYDTLIKYGGITRLWVYP